MNTTFLTRSGIVLLALVLLGMPAGLKAESRRVDMETFVSLVEQYSKELKLAEKDCEEANAQKREATAGVLPHVSGQASYTRNLSDVYMYFDLSSLSGGEGGIQKVVYNRNNEYQAGVTLRQTLFSGNVFNAIKAAREYGRMTNYTYDATHQQILTLARQAFSYTLLLGQVVEVAGQSEQNAHENYLDTKSRYDNGLASEYALLQAESRYRETVPRTAEAERNLTLAMIDLKNMAGIPVDQTVELEGSLDSYPEPPVQVDLQTVLSRRPDYNALLRRERLQKINVSAQRSGYFPSLEAVAGYGYSAQSDAFRLDEENNSWTAGLVLSVPIFQGGATRARVSQARVQLDKSRLELARLRDRIVRDIRSVRLRLDEAHSRIASAEVSLQTARKAFSIAEETNRVGMTTQLELKDARVALDQATVNYYSAIFDYLRACYDWQQVIGVADAESSADAGVGTK